MQVLSYFLDVFGDFDWDSNCLTLHGGVPIKAVALGQGEPIAQEIPMGGMCHERTRGGWRGTCQQCFLGTVL